MPDQPATRSPLVQSTPALTVCSTDVDRDSSQLIGQACTWHTAWPQKQWKAKEPRSGGGSGAPRDFPVPITSRLAARGAAIRGGMKQADSERGSGRGGVAPLFARLLQVPPVIWRIPEGQLGTGQRGEDHRPKHVPRRTSTGGQREEHGQELEAVQSTLGEDIGRTC